MSEYDPKTINQMTNLANALNDIDNGVAPKSQTGGETGDNLFQSTQLIENILGKLSDIGGFDYENRDYSDLQVSRDFKSEDSFFVNENLNSIYSDTTGIDGAYEEGTIPQDAYVPIPNYHTPVLENAPVYAKPLTPWTMVSEDVKGLKNAKKYSIQNAYNKQNIIEGIMMREAATAILNVLNEGGTISDTKVLGIISYGIQYTKILESALKSVKTRQYVLSESNYSRAAELDTEIANYRTQAQSLKEKVMGFISTNGFSTK